MATAAPGGEAVPREVWKATETNASSALDRAPGSILFDGQKMDCQFITAKKNATCSFAVVLV